MEVFVGDRPRHVVGLIVDEAIAAKKDPQAAQVVQQHYNLAKRGHCVDKYILVVSIKLRTTHLHRQLEGVVQKPNLVYPQVFYDREVYVHSTRNVGQGRYDI